MFANVGNSSCPRRTAQPRARWRGRTGESHNSSASIRKLRKRRKNKEPSAKARCQFRAYPVCRLRHAFAAYTANGDRPFWRPALSHLARAQKGTSCVLSSCSCIHTSPLSLSSSSSPLLRWESIKQKHCRQDLLDGEMAGCAYERILLTMMMTTGERLGNCLAQIVFEAFERVVRVCRSTPRSRAFAFSVGLAFTPRSCWQAVKKALL